MLSAKVRPTSFQGIVCNPFGRDSWNTRTCLLSPGPAGVGLRSCANFEIKVGSQCDFGIMKWNIEVRRLERFAFEFSDVEEKLLVYILSVKIV